MATAQVLPPGAWKQQMPEGAPQTTSGVLHSQCEAVTVSTFQLCSALNNYARSPFIWSLITTAAQQSQVNRVQATPNVTKQPLHGCCGSLEHQPWLISTGWQLGLHCLHRGYSWEPWLMQPCQQKRKLRLHGTFSVHMALQ